MMLNKPRLRFLPAILYLLAISILFFLPGTAFPQNNWMTRIWFDKWVHVGMFAVLIWVWSWAGRSERLISTWIVAAAFYGICVEWIQHNFVAYRTFDAGDWIADLAGIFLGTMVWRQSVKK